MKRQHGDTGDKNLSPAVTHGLLLGTASSAFQVEGGRSADGRGPSIWDTFIAGKPGSAEAGCDHYHRWRDDLELLSGLGVDAYRFSIAWSRIFPDGGRRPNARALGFYERLAAELRELGIAPMVCLYHWDLPQWLQDRGGWRSRETACHLGELAAVMADRLGDAVERWATINEPFMHLLRGHIVGDHAPGLTLEDWSSVAHHLLIGHAEAVSALRAAGVGGSVGVIENVSPVRPAGAEPADQQAAFIFDLLRNQLMLGALLQGSYPEMLLARRPTLAAAIQDGDMEAIAAPLDFLGVNYYGPTGARAAPPGTMPPWQLVDLEGLPTTGVGSAIDPDGLRETLLMLGQRYPDTLPPLLVTEVGVDLPDRVDEPGECDDTARIEFIASHLRAIDQARSAGADVRGAFVWSLLDSFEWEHGYGPRYGLVHVDFETAARTPKRSFHWLAQAIAERGRADGAVAVAATAASGPDGVPG
jgi:beta-glucosidase